jgi:sec-independent protein translocase protein TatA
MPIGLGPWELIIILLIVVVIFGAGRLSEIGGAVGKSIREFRKATDNEQAAGKTDQQAVAAPVAAAPVAAVPVAPVAAVPVAPVTPPAPLAAAPTAVATAPVAVAENTCPSCATVNPATQVFCGQCGTRLTLAA